MAKRRRRKKRRSSIRITPLGYFVLGILVVIAIIGIYFMIWSMSVEANPTELNNVTPPPDALSTFMIADPNAPTPTLPPITTPTVSPIPTPTPGPTPEPTPSPGMANDVRMPTKEQVQSAADGKLLNSGVVLRKGPDSGYEIVNKYASGTKLLIYAEEGEYYFVQTLSDQKYGYMAKKFIERTSLLPGEEPTPTPVVKEGTVPGTVTATKLALRKMPATEDNTPIGECNKDSAVWIYFQTNGFYYVEVIGSGEKGYMSMDYITCLAAVPAGTPIPG